MLIAKSDSNPKIDANFLIGIAIMVGINFLFVWKYTSRIIDFPFFIALSLALIQVLATFLFWKTSFIDKLPANFIVYPFILAVIILALVTPYFVEEYTLNVDRHSVISSFWESYFNGDYPYSARSHMDNPPGPMPFYFILSLPFYLLDQLALFSALGYLTLPIIAKNYLSNRELKILVLLLASSSFMYWEILCRSNIFTNAVLVSSCLYYYFLSYNLDKRTYYFFFGGLVFGLLLSTRSIFIIAYMVAFKSQWKTRLISTKKLLILILGGIVGFSLSFLPFTIPFWD